MAFRIFIEAMESALKNILKQFWGYDSFRKSQKEIVLSVMDGNNTLALLPTGGGKSICYQVPAMAKEGICIVISPLIALMKDQVKNLNNRGIKALAIYSGMNAREIDIALDNCVYGNYKFLYVSPERLQTEIFKVRVTKMNVNLIAVDESHCISQWGHDFRPAYLKIRELKQIIDPSVPFLAVTATANKRVIKDISEQLDINLRNIVKQSFYRKNLGYLVLKEENKKKRLISILTKTNSSSIVYTNTRKKTVETANLLVQNGFKADFYHGGLPQNERDLKQQSWIENKTQIIVATNAFGMGIDKPDVKVVVHLEPPASPEAYFQEAGRGGRDGKKSYAALLYKPSDKLQLEKFHEFEFPDISLIKKIYNSLGNYFRLAIGSGENQGYEFDISDFCNQYSFDIIKSHHAISILGLAGYLSLSESISRPNRVKFEVNNNELYNYQVKHPEDEKLIQLLLRKHENIFDNLIGVNLTWIAEKLKTKPAEIERKLFKLKSFNILDFIPAFNKPILTFVRERVHEGRIKIPKEIYKDRKRIKKEQLDFMIRYCESDKICRSKLLLSYFDESEFENCDICDICLSQKKEELNSSKFEMIETLIEDQLKLESKKLNELVNSISGFKEKEILEVIQWKLDCNELDYNKNHKLFSTKKGE